MKVLVTGGMGYIGSHICTELLLRGHRVAVLVRPTAQIWRTASQVEILTGTRPWVFRCDIRQEMAVTRVLRTYKPDMIIHCAGIKTSGDTPDSHQNMFDTNVGGMQSLLRAMTHSDSRHLINLSSAASKGSIDMMSSYGQSKMVAEQVLNRHVANDSRFHKVTLRLHNVAGNHPTGFLAEDELSCAHSLFTLMVKGMTHEGAPIPIYPILRDYCHVSDVAAMMVPVMDYVLKHCVLRPIDVGSGVGIQPIDILHEFERLNGTSIPHRLTNIPVNMPQRCVANIADARQLFNWACDARIKDLCRDTWFTHTTGNNRNTPPPFTRIASCRSLL